MKTTTSTCSQRSIGRQCPFSLCRGKATDHHQSPNKSYSDLGFFVLFFIFSHIFSYDFLSTDHLNLGKLWIKCCLSWRSGVTHVFITKNMCIFGSKGVKIALFHTRWRSEEPVPLTDQGREKDLCTKVWDCIMQKVTSGREKRKHIALRTVCADQPPAAFGRLTGQLQPCWFLPACHFHKVVTGSASLCSPRPSRGSPGTVCTWCDSEDRKGWEVLLPNVFLSASTSEGCFSDVLHGCVRGSFTMFPFPRDFKRGRYSP